jgi:hypothetical protein
MGQTYDKFFDTRQKGDYADLVRFAVDDVRPWLAEARVFVDAVEALSLQQIARPSPECPGDDSSGQI